MNDGTTGSVRLLEGTCLAMNESSGYPLEPVRVPAAVAAPDAAATEHGMTPKARWALAITSLAVFMVTLDNLVVTTAIPVLREDLHAGLSGLQWTVNAYTLTLAVLLLTGAALGDRFGRRRLLGIGIGSVSAAAAAGPGGAWDGSRGG